MSLGATVLGAKDARALAAFYQDLLGWEVTDDEPDWVELPAPDGGAGLSFQTEENHVPPVWPTTAIDQQMMMHLDIAVSDLDEAVAAAQALGASLAQWQPRNDFTVMIDPAGHPFCLYEPED
ncbi:MAG: VOC family protein [Actinobacteria bacterium]|nr:MAG: VOC family protein [Actinomycetota bacterium]